MNILFLPNWTVHNLDEDSDIFQDPDKYVVGNRYWFFKYFPEEIHVDVIDIHKDNYLSIIERKLKFYIYQAILAFKIQRKYDLIISHGAQSGVLLALLRRLFGKGNTKHLIFDIGGMNGARNSGFSTRIIRFALKSNPFIICHSTNIIDNIRRNYHWLLPKTTFIHFGVGLNQYAVSKNSNNHEIFVFSGKKRDEETVFEAWRELADKDLIQDFTIYFVGSKSKKHYKNCFSVSWLPYKEYLKKLSDSAFAILPLEEYEYSYGQMSLLGSMALGKTVIASNVSGISDYTKLCKSIVSVPQNDVAEMKSAILNQIINFHKKKNLIARNEVIQFFNEKDMADKIYKFIEQINNVYDA